MLVTHPRKLMQNHFYALDHGEMLWEMVDMQLSQHYYFVSFTLEEGEAWTGQHAILWQLHSVVGLCCVIQNSPKKELKQVSVLMPPYASESNQWEMTALKEIWMATHKKSQKELFVLVAKNGRRFTEDRTEDLSDNALEKIERLIISTSAQGDQTN